MELLLLFFEFLKIGFFTIGGGYAMIPLLKETVLKYGWLSETQFYNFIGICESTPGPIAINMATYIGSIHSGFLGSLVATIGVTLPSFIIILLIAKFFTHIMDNKYVKFAFLGINSVVLGLILSTGLILLAKSIGYINLSSFQFNLASMIILFIIMTISFILKKIFHFSGLVFTVIGKYIISFIFLWSTNTIIWHYRRIFGKNIQCFKK